MADRLPRLPDAPSRSARSAEGGADDGESSSARIPTGRRGELVWGPVRLAWFAWRIANARDLHVNGAYAWDVGRYVPVVYATEGGSPFVGFRR